MHSIAYAEFQQMTSDGLFNLNHRIANIVKYSKQEKKIKYVKYFKSKMFHYKRDILLPKGQTEIIFVHFKLKCAKKLL